MPKLTVQSLDIILYASLSVEVQVTAVVRSASCHLRLVSQLVPYFSTSNLTTVIQATVTFRLYYCSSLCMGLPLGLFWKLQRVQNATTGSSVQMHIQSVLHQLD